MKLYLEYEKIEELVIKKPDEANKALEESIKNEEKTTEEIASAISSAVYEKLMDEFMVHHIYFRPVHFYWKPIEESIELDENNIPIEIYKDFGYLVWKTYNDEETHGLYDFVGVTDTRRKAIQLISIQKIEEGVDYHIDRLPLEE